jgi:hypothetical protein
VFHVKQNRSQCATEGFKFRWRVKFQPLELARFLPATGGRGLIPCEQPGLRSTNGSFTVRTPEPGPRGLR